ncbi:MAG: 30S ribosome-binding factor RbfA [Candidatus Omnitrophica bacterium]|nr:30S ribosome-binding factor RbfA [Candidatus Omnitrophota bacterium]
MSNTRPQRVQEALRQEISKILHENIKDPRIGFLTVTKVELTRDLRFARVYFSVLGSTKENKNALYGLNSAKGYIKNIISDRIKLKFMPEIEFKIDQTAERAKVVLDILDKIKKERKDEEGRRGDKKI